METCRTRSGEKRAGGLGNFAETRDRSWLELGSRLVGKMEKQELPLHCAVSKQPDPRKERSSSPLLFQQPSYRPLHGIGGRRKGVTINRTNSRTGPEYVADVTLPRFSFCIEFPGGNYERRPRGEREDDFRHIREGDRTRNWSWGGGDASRDGDKLSRWRGRVCIPLPPHRNRRGEPSRLFFVLNENGNDSRRENFKGEKSRNGAPVTFAIPWKDPTMERREADAWQKKILIP